MTVHARPPHAQLAGVCSWRHHLEDVDLECDSPAVVGSDECDGTDHPHRPRVPRRRPHSRFVCDETGCGQQARWYLTSGPMFVCWQHKLHYESEGEQTSPLSGGGA